MADDQLSTRGIARTADLNTQGWTRHRLAKAVSAGELIRPRRGWISLPSADPELLLAVRHGVLLSCITQAVRMGLWVKEAAVSHLAVRQAGAQTRPDHAVLHWRKPLIPRAPGVIEDPIENVLNHVAHCQKFEDAVAVWDSALNKRLVDRSTLARLPLRGAAKEVLEASSGFAESGLESFVRLRLRWLRVRVTAQAWILGHRVDFLLGERLVLQIDGGHHVGPQRTSDISHDAELVLRGYAVIRVGYEQVVHRWPEVQARIMQAIAQGLHLESA